MEENFDKTRESVTEYIHLAKDVSGISLIKKLKKVLSKDSTVLEIGSGLGTDWTILSELFRTTGSDNSPELLKHLIQTNPTGEFLELDASSLKTERTFDAIYSNKVLHHLKDDELHQSIQRQSEILNSKGVICHSFWNGEGSEVFKGLFVNYHNKEHLTENFESKFKILLFIEYQEFEPNDSIFLIARKKGIFI
tara:strand:- start:39746 stop:40327 length:582 start_codon:yes stop_codon:yes gene_type:complete